MSMQLLTFLIVFILVILSIATLAISWLMSGKSRIVRNNCESSSAQPKDNAQGQETNPSSCISQPEEKS